MHEFTNDQLLEMPEIYSTDESLIKLIHDDDYVSYNKLFERYFKRLCQYVYSILLNKDDAEDVVQELFLNLWKYRKRIKITGNATHYIFRMAKYLAINTTRSSVSFTSILDNLDNPQLAYIDDPLEKDEFRIALYDCIDRLPQRSREIFLLERIEGMKQKEIAEKLNISVKTIKQHIWISLQKLRTCMKLKNM